MKYAIWVKPLEVYMNKSFLVFGHAMIGSHVVIETIKFDTKEEASKLIEDMGQTYNYEVVEYVEEN